MEKLEEQFRKKPRAVYLDNRIVRVARAIGGGNISGGIRRALEECRGCTVEYENDASKRIRLVTLTDADVERAMRLGVGNISAGIRCALASRLRRRLN